jgi:hypothetical protein
MGLLSEYRVNHMTDPNQMRHEPKGVRVGSWRIGKLQVGNIRSRRSSFSWF